MADHSANIDLVFRNGLKDFEVLPPPELWEGIRPVVRKKSQATLYMRAAVIAGFLAGGGALAWYLGSNLGDNLNGPAITLNQDSHPEGKYTPPAIRLNAAPRNSGEEKLIVAEPFQVSESAVKESGFNFIPSSITLNPPAGNLNRTDRQTSLLLASTARVLSPPDISLATVETPKVHQNRWSLGAIMSPTYFSKFGTASSDQEKTLTASENTTLSYSGGMSFGFKVNKRISLQMGILYNSMNQEIDGVRSYSGFTKFYAMKGTDNFEVATSTGRIISRNNDIFLANLSNGTKVSSLYSSDIFDPNKAGLTYINNTVLQSFNYLEVPLFIRYKLIDRTLGMNVIGGVSYNRLLNNSAYAVSGQNKYYIGETDGMYPFILSSSLGLGMEYSLSKNISINLEPTFKYFLTPLNSQTGSSMHPYTFGIFSGLSWKF